MVHNISRRVSNLSSNEIIFNNNAEYYNDALKNTGYWDRLAFYNKNKNYNTLDDNRKLVDNEMSGSHRGHVVNLIVRNNDIITIIKILIGASVVTIFSII